MSHSVLSNGQFNSQPSESANDHEGDAAPTGHWHLGMGSHAADKGYGGPGGTMEGEHPDWQKTFAGELRPRGNTQGADPVIKDKANRANVQLHPDSQPYGPAGKVCVSRAYSNAAHTDTGRNVRILPSAHGDTDFKRVAKGGA